MRRTRCKKEKRDQTRKCASQVEHPVLMFFFQSGQPLRLGRLGNTKLNETELPYPMPSGEACVRCRGNSRLHLRNGRNVHAASQPLNAAIFSLLLNALVPPFSLTLFRNKTCPVLSQMLVEKHSQRGGWLLKMRAFDLSFTRTCRAGDKKYVILSFH